MASVSMFLWRLQHPIRTVDRMLAAPFSTRHNRTRKRRDFPPRTKQRKLPFTRIALSRFNQEEQKDQSVDPAHVAMLYSQPRPFNPFIIKIPFRMGRPKPGENPPLAVTTPEILKIPNFFHLTPPTIKKQCEALKPLCTPWPKELPSLPIKITTRNFVFPSHDVRHTESRIVKLLVALADLSLTDHARNKMIQLAGRRYDSETDTVTIVGKRCPTRKQNKQYAMYLLKVLYLESNKIEPWEDLQD